MSVKLCQNFVKPIFRGILKSRNPGVRNAREPDALSGRFACARLGETRKKGRWTATFVTAHLGEGILLLMGRRSREFRPVP